MENKKPVLSGSVFATAILGLSNAIPAQLINFSPLGTGVAFKNGFAQKLIFSKQGF